MLTQTYVHDFSKSIEFVNKLHSIIKWSNAHITIQTHFNTAEHQCVSKIKLRTTWVNDD